MLSSIGMHPDEEVLTPSGYRLDALVEVNGTTVGIDRWTISFHGSTADRKYTSKTQTSD